MALYDVTSASLTEHKIECTYGYTFIGDWGSVRLTTNGASARLEGYEDFEQMSASRTEDLRNILNTIDEIMGWNDFAPEPEE